MTTQGRRHGYNGGANVKPEAYIEGSYKKKDPMKPITSFTTQRTSFIALSNFCDYDWQGWYFCLPSHSKLISVSP